MVSQTQHFLLEHLLINCMNYKTLKTDSICLHFGRGFVVPKNWVDIDRTYVSVTTPGLVHC